jgi:protein-S-isoprenylcysteine O-methyltransferase Ste14
MAQAAKKMNAPDNAPRLLKQRQRHSRLFVLLLIPICILCMGIIGDESIAHEILDWCGLFLVVIAVLGRSYCSAFLGGIKNEVIMREGPFSVVRNPLYVCSFIGVVGIGMQSGMLTVLMILVGAFLLYYPKVVAKEEVFLKHKFGEPYGRYLREVPRWWPKWSLWHEPETITVRPYFLRHTMMDALIFFLPMVVFELLEILRATGMMPALLQLP